MKLVEFNILFEIAEGDVREPLCTENEELLRVWYGPEVPEETRLMMESACVNPECVSIVMPKTSCMTTIDTPDGQMVILESYENVKKKLQGELK